jgi:hypothetical protein
MKENKAVESSGNPIRFLCDGFLDKSNVSRYGLKPSNLLDHFHLGESADGFYISKDKNSCIKAFTSFLEENGYTANNDGEAVELVGSMYNGDFLHHWLRYSRPNEKDLWVNSNGFKINEEGLIYDIFLTTSPDRIVVNRTSAEIAFSGAILKNLSVRA